MNAQNIIVAVIVLGALLYVGNILRRKVRAFKPKDASCGADCGCGTDKPSKLAVKRASLKN